METQPVDSTQVLILKDMSCVIQYMRRKRAVTMTHHNTCKCINKIKRTKHQERNTEPHLKAVFPFPSATGLYVSGLYTYMYNTQKH